MDSASQYNECASSPDLDTESILRGLNPAQLDAVTSPANVVQILAPPGSGKTRTLTARVAYLLANNHYNPANVIVATFTVKASREMKERIGKLVGNGLERKLILGTFHSIARRYLVRYGHLIGIKKGFGIADSGDSAGIIKRIIKRHQFSVDASSARSRISNIKAQGMSYDQYMAQNEKTMKKDVNLQEFVALYQEYEAALQQANLLDYDDLLLKCVDLLKAHPECARNIEAVLVDEFQDTNLVQFDLMRGFAKWKKRVTVVGDPDQSIYGFRAAEIKNLKRMQTVYPDTLVVILEDNYRSSASILQSAQVVIEQDDARPNKMLLPTHSVGTRPVLRHLRDASQEAQWIVCEIKRIMGMTGDAIIPSDIAILVRSASLTRNIEAALAQHGISYKMVGGQKFYDRVEVKAVLDYLRVCQNPQNNDALSRVVNVPPRKVGDTTIKALLEESHRKKKSLWDLIRGCVRGELKLSTNVTKTAEQGLSAFVNVILTSRKMLLQEEGQEAGGVDAVDEEGAAKSPGTTLVDIVYYLMKKLAYRDYLEKHYPEDHASRWANIEELVMQAADFTNTLASNPTEDEEALPEIDGIVQQKPSAMADALDRFLANVALASEVKQDENEEPREQVTISTIHAAKGLEWPVVFIPGCYEGSIPHSRSEDTDEERRLLYVAMTRAMGLLYMSCPKKNSKYEKSALSQFLKDPNVLKLMDKKGPSLTPSVSQGILQILGKECPALSTIQMAMAHLESVEDDLFPIGDTLDSDDEDNRKSKRQRVEQDDYDRGMQKASSLGWGGGGGGGGQGFSKPKGWSGNNNVPSGGGGGGGFVSARTISTSTTTTASYSTSATTTTSINSASSFSISAASMSGFTSARGYMTTINRGTTEASLGINKQTLTYTQTSGSIHRSSMRETDTSETRTYPPKRPERTTTKLGKDPGSAIAPPVGRKKTTSAGQGNLLGFLKKPNPAGEGTGTAGSSSSRQGVVLGNSNTVKSLKKKEEFVFLSSSPVKPTPIPIPRKSPPTTLSRTTPSPSPPLYEEFMASIAPGPALHRTTTLEHHHHHQIPEIYEEEVEEEDNLDSLPPPLPPAPPPLSHPLKTTPSLPTFIPDSDAPEEGDIDIDADAEEAYQEIESLNPTRYEPVLPKPFLTRSGSGSVGEFASAAFANNNNKRGIRLVDPPEPRVASVFIQAAAAAAANPAAASKQQKKTLGIRRSMNGWESRQHVHPKPSSSSSSSGGGAGTGTGAGVRKSKGRGRGFIGGLLG